VTRANRRRLVLARTRKTASVHPSKAQGPFPRSHPYLRTLNALPKSQRGQIHALITAPAKHTSSTHIPLLLSAYMSKTCSFLSTTQPTQLPLLPLFSLDSDFRSIRFQGLAGPWHLTSLCTVYIHSASKFNSNSIPNTCESIRSSLLAMPNRSTFPGVLYAERPSECALGRSPLGDLP